MNYAKNCYTIPAFQPFLRTLAEWIIREYGADTHKFTSVLLLLPNRRACRAMREAFLECSGGKPMLLPKIKPIGEVDGEEFFLNSDDFLNENEPVIDETHRHFLLISLLLSIKPQDFRGHNGFSRAAELASKLANFMDEVSKEEIDFARLQKLAPENLSAHWQEILNFLDIIVREYPRKLAELGLVDNVKHRQNQTEKLCKLWKQSPPAFPVIAAGSTGSVPSTAKLLKTIANLPNGAVFLPPVDTQMSDKEWEIIGETHPEYGLKKLLEKLELDRNQIELIHNNSVIRHPPSVIRHIFAPAEATANWANIALETADELKHIKLLEADTLLEEAQKIAVAMRETLETPEKTAALITTDRTLARMVSAQMARFGVIVDDSAGKPLINSAPASFLRLVIDMVAARFSPITLLSVLRHPLAAAELKPHECRKLSRDLEKNIIRKKLGGIRPEEGLATLRQLSDSNELNAMLTNLEQKSKLLLEFFTPYKANSFSDILREHIAIAEWLATSDTEAGVDRLWAGEAGNALAECVSNWSGQAHILPSIESMMYPAFFEELLAKETYRSQFGLHPRLHILSPMEARLIRFDLAILSGLNEKSWPKAADSDPWMSRPQRAEFGLPSYTRAVGQSANDFYMQLLSANEILLTRAKKVEGKPTVASRWWVRLETLLSAKIPEIFASMNQKNYFASASELLDKPADMKPISAPCPAPPVYTRPREMRVTDIDKWLQNPYLIYAKYVLKLKPLEELDREPSAADFGNIVHKTMEIFTAKFPRNLPDDVYAEIIDAGKTAFGEFIHRPSVHNLWWSRFAAMAEWLADMEKIRRNNTQQIYSEVDASWKFAVDDKDFTLKTRIDRLEKLADGKYNIIDYKTGSVPSKKEIEDGTATQLPLMALITENGELKQELKNATVNQMEYWKLTTGAVTPANADLNKTMENLENLIREFDNAETAYSAPNFIKNGTYNDYEHLERRAEWEEG